MADEEARVRREGAVDLAEILLERAPVPRHPFFEGTDGHALDASKHVQQVVRVLGTERRDREATVAAHHRRHSVQRRRRQRRVPEHLRVVVGMDVDEAGRDHLAVGFDRARRAIVDLADGRDASVLDCDVRAVPGTPGAVDHRSVADDQIEHDPTIVHRAWVTHS